MVHTLLVLAATCCCFCFLLFPLFFSLATTSIFYLMKNNYYFFHSPSHFLLHSFIVSVSTFAHLPFSIPYAASPYYLLPVVIITPSIHRSLPPSFQQPHLHLPHHTLHYMHAHSDSYTTRTRDCEHQQYRHCRPNLLRLFSLELQRKRPPLKATSGCSVELFCASCAPTSFVEGLFNWIFPQVCQEMRSRPSICLTTTRKKCN